MKTTSNFNSYKDEYGTTLASTRINSNDLKTDLSDFSATNGYFEFIFTYDGMNHKKQLPFQFLTDSTADNIWTIYNHYFMNIQHSVNGSTLGNLIDQKIKDVNIDYPMIPLITSNPEKTVDENTKYIYKIDSIYLPDYYSFKNDTTTYKYYQIRILDILGMDASGIMQSGASDLTADDLLNYNINTTPTTENEYSLEGTYDGVELWPTPTISTEDFKKLAFNTSGTNTVDYNREYMSFINTEMTIYEYIELIYLSSWYKPSANIKITSDDTPWLSLETRRIKNHNLTEIVVQDYGTVYNKNPSQTYVYDTIYTLKGTAPEISGGINEISYNVVCEASIHENLYKYIGADVPTRTQQYTLTVGNVIENITKFEFTSIAPTKSYTFGSEYNYIIQIPIPSTYTNGKSQQELKNLESKLTLTLDYNHGWLEMKNVRLIKLDGNYELIGTLHGVLPLTLSSQVENNNYKYI